MDHRSRRARAIVLAVTAAVLAAAPAHAQSPGSRAAATSPSAGQLVLATDSFQVRQTSDTTVELIGQGTDASLGHFRVQLGDGAVGTTPVAFWAELWNWLKSHVSVGYSNGCVTISINVPIGIGRYKGTFKGSVTIC
jgi:hypothetical protein